jgi:hypothetical protein
MKSKIALIALLVLTLTFPSLGCFSNDEDEGPSMAQTVKDHTAQIASLRTDVNKKADQSTVDALTKLIGAPQSDTYTKAQVDAQIKSAVDAAISKLKSDQSWIEEASSGGGDSDSEDVEGELSKSGSLILSLDRSIEDELYLGDGESQTIKLSVTNSDTTSHTFRLTANFDCNDDAVAMTNASLSADYSYSAGAVMKLNTTMPATVQTINFTSRRSSTATDTTWYIGKGKTESVYLKYTVDYVDAAANHTWDWDFTIKEVD